MILPLGKQKIITEDGEEIEIAYAFTPEDVENYKKRKEAEQEFEWRRLHIQRLNDEAGDFVFLLYNINEALAFGVQPATLTRLIYLSTYMDYNNRLCLSRVTSMTQQDIKKVLKVSQSTYERFVDEVFGKKIITKDEDGRLYLDTNIFLRGSVAKLSKNSIDKNLIRVYYNGVREIYKKAKISEHSKLAYLFQMIPFVNVQYNMLCHNPLETEMKYVQPMTMPEYCSIVGYSLNHIHRLKTFLKKITLDGLPVFSFVENNEGLFCYVNPNVFYAGKNHDKIEVLELFTKKNK